MSETIKGKPVIWGIATTVAATGITATYYITSVDFSPDAQKVKITNAKGQTVAKVYFDQMDKVTIECIPTGANLAAAKASQQLPRPGTVVTITDTDDDGQMLGDGTGVAYKYLVESCSKKKSATDVVKLTMELERYIDVDVAATVS